MFLITIFVLLDEINFYLLALFLFVMWDKLHPFFFISMIIFSTYIALLNICKILYIQ